jgi:hypothetical protein
MRLLISTILEEPFSTIQTRNGDYNIKIIDPKKPDQGKKWVKGHRGRPEETKG